MQSTKWMIGAVLALAAAVPSAQQPGFTRTLMQDQNLSAHGRHAVVARAEFIPGGQAGRHTHPG
ncbi:MAG TPA: cupin domain-containing protein, partial [Burkholderiales bacterium]